MYRWPGLAGLAVTAPSPRFGFEALCGSPPVADDPRAYAVAARSVVLHPAGQWNLLVQVVHWRGDTATGGPTALATLETARSRLRDCQSTAAQASPSITTNEPQRIAAVISDAGDQVMHEYLLADPEQQHNRRTGHVVVAAPAGGLARRGRRAGLRRDGRAAVQRIHRVVPVRRSRHCRR